MTTSRERKLFARRLKELRKQLDLTQAELATKAKLTASAISQFESEDREPTFSSMIKLARALRVSPSFLSGLEEFDIPDEMKAFYREHRGLTKEDQEALKLVAAVLKARVKREEQG